MREALDELLVCPVQASSGSGDGSDVACSHGEWRSVHEVGQEWRRRSPRPTSWKRERQS